MWDNLNKLNILVLNGSPKMNNSSTMKVTNAFLEGIKNKKDCDIEIINIQALNIKPCIGCLSCWGRRHTRLGYYRCRPCRTTPDDACSTRRADPPE